MLNTQSTLASYDDFYEALLTAHQGLSTEESHAMNARLVLLLSNHIGDLRVLRSTRRAPSVPSSSLISPLRADWVM